MVCKIFAKRSDKIQLDTVLSFLKGIFSITKPTPQKKKEIIKLVNEIFTKTDIEEEDPDEEVTYFDFSMNESQGKHVSAPSFSEEKYQETMLKNKGKTLIRTSIHEEKSLLQQLKDEIIDLKTKDLKEIKEEIKENAIEKVKEIGNELKDILKKEKKNDEKKGKKEKKELELFVSSKEEHNQMKEVKENKEEKIEIEKKEFDLKKESIEKVEIKKEEEIKVKEEKEIKMKEEEEPKLKEEEIKLKEEEIKMKEEHKVKKEEEPKLKEDEIKLKEKEESKVEESKVKEEIKKENLVEKIHEDDFEIDLNDFDEIDQEGKKKNWKDWLHEKLNTTRGIQDLSRKEFYKKIKKINEFIECFGLFDLTSKIMDGLEKLKLYDMGNVVYRYGSPLLSGYIKGNIEGYAIIQFGYLIVYFGKKSEKEIQGLNPSVVFNLREAIVVDRVFKKHRINTNLSKLKGLEEDDDEKEFIITINKINYKIEVEDSVEKWVWALRMNSGVINYPNDSFAPIRKHCGCEFFHCGQQYFDELAKWLKRARQQIIICGWFFTPHYFLNRNPENDRIDEILIAKAKEGVKVYILVWKDPGIILDNGSLEVEQYFTGLKLENIHVIRDPSSFGLVIWSHHQKTVVIDQEIAFCGGIDIAYNRFEIPGVYPLYDTKGHHFYGLDYVNPLIRQKNTGDPKQSNYDRSWEPRMPWNDIQVKVTGIGALDIARNFIERWNHAAQENKEMKYKGSLSPSLTTLHSRFDEPYPNCKVQVLRSISSWGFGVQLTESSIEKAYISLIERAKRFIYIENQFFISSSNKNQKYPENQILSALLGK